MTLCVQRRRPEAVQRVPSTRRRRRWWRNGKRASACRHPRSVLRFASVNRVLATLNGRWQTDARTERRKAVSPLFTVVTRGFCISGPLSEKGREIRMSRRRAFFLKIPPNSCLWHRGAAEARHGKGVGESIWFSCGRFKRHSNDQESALIVFAIWSDYDDDYGGENMLRKVSYSFIQSLFRLFCQSARWLI